MNNEIQEIRYQVGEAWKGTYNAGTTYGNANVVQDPTGLSVYRSLKPGNVGHPLTDTAWWFLIIDLSSIKEESDRIKALNDAIAADEAQRVENENGRVTAEQGRVDAENARVTAEQGRVTAEQQRVLAEQQRASQEQTRISQEQSRVTAEQGRVAAEAQRVQKEQLRENNEAQRVINETNRVSAEAERVEQYAADHQQAVADHDQYVDSLGAFDISAYHATGGVLAKYADLTAALGTGGANIPEAIRKGGMSVKFVQSSDNKYVQYMYKGTSTSAADFTNVDNWEKMNLEEEVSQLGQEIVSYNKLTAPVTWIDGKYLKLSNGTDDSYVGWSITDYIEISPSSNMSFSDYVEGTGTAALCYYDEDKNYLGGVGIGTYADEQMIAPTNAKYVRFCSMTTSKGSFSFNVGLYPIVGEKKQGAYFSSGPGLDNFPYSVAGVVLNKYKVFKSLKVASIATGNMQFHIVDEDNYAIIETITKALTLGENIILPSDFEFDFENDNRNICIYSQNVSNQESDRLIPFSASGTIIPYKCIRTFDSNIGNSLQTGNDFSIAMEITYYEKNIPAIDKQVETIGGNTGNVPIIDLQQYLNNHSGEVIQLGAQVFNISTHLVIPNGTRICGIRGKTIFRLRGNATECVYFDGNSKDITIENITFEGGTPITASATTMANVRSRAGEGTKCGIYSLGYAKDIQICHCEFRNFNLAGIRILNSFTDTFYETYKITDCNFAYNFYGLLSDRRSEYHTVMGCSMCYNQIGCFIEGGNNFMSCCHFERNSVGCVISGVQATNDSHGTIAGSSFNHNYTAGIMCLNVRNGYCFEGCHVFQGGIYIDHSKGINYNGGIIACNIYYSDSLENTHNMIHNAIFSDTSYNYTISGGDETLSLHNNRYIDKLDSSDINNSY